MSADNEADLPSLTQAKQRSERIRILDLPEGRFVTLALLDVHASAHDVQLLSAGHGPTLHIRGTVGTNGSAVHRHRSAARRHDRRHDQADGVIVNSDVSGRWLAIDSGIELKDRVIVLAGTGRTRGRG